MTRRDSRWGAGTRWGWLGLLAVLLVWSARGSQVDPRLLLGQDGRYEIGRFLVGLFPPDLSFDFVTGLVQPALETIQMSVLGVVFGAAIAWPLAVFGTRTGVAAERSGDGRIERFARSWPYASARSILNVMRTIPDLVWALMFIAAVGLGPFAGVLALTVHSAGLLGKLYAEAMEAVDQAPVETLRATGAGALGTLLWGVVPQCRAPLVSVTLYQWECNIRAAMVLGFVGAGGLGQRIDLAMRLFRYEEMLTLLVVLLVLVTLVDRASAFVRGRMLRTA